MGLHAVFTTPATFDTVRGGGERYARNLARGLVLASGGWWTVDIVAPSHVGVVEDLEHGISMRGVVTFPIGSAYGDGVGWGLVDAIARSDLVHVHQMFTRFGEAAVLAGRAYGRPVCVTDHGGMTSPVGRRLGLVKVANATVAYSRFGADALGDAPNVRIVEGGVDATFFSPADHDVVRDRVVFAGRIMAHKGIDRLIRASPPGTPVVIAGTVVELDYFNVLRARAAQRDITFMIDPSDADLRETYRRALAVVLPSVHVDMYGRVHRYPELMGLTALEGMACGAPAVVTRAGGLPEYVDDGVTGFVVETERELADRLHRLAADVSLVERLGIAARTRALNEWDLGVAGSKLLALYTELTGSLCASSP